MFYACVAKYVYSHSRETAYIYLPRWINASQLRFLSRFMRFTFCTSFTYRISNYVSSHSTVSILYAKAACSAHCISILTGGIANISVGQEGIDRKSVV